MSFVGCNLIRVRFFINTVQDFDNKFAILISEIWFLSLHNNLSYLVFGNIRLTCNRACIFHVQYSAFAFKVTALEIGY